MNIFLRELKANLKSLIIWSIIIALFIVVGVSKFSAYAGNPEMLKILDAFPPAVLEAFGMRAFNLTTVSGFYGIMFVYFGLLGAIAASMWGSDIISKEERDKTVEFSLVLPVSRSRVITAKAFAALVNCIVLVFVIWGVSLLAVKSYNPDQAFYDFAALQMRALFVVELIFLARRADAGLRDEAVPACRLHCRGYHPGHLLHVCRHRHARKAGFPQVVHTLQVF